MQLETWKWDLHFFIYSEPYLKMKENNQTLKWILLRNARILPLPRSRDIALSSCGGSDSSPGRPHRKLRHVYAVHPASSPFPWRQRSRRSCLCKLWASHSSLAVVALSSSSSASLVKREGDGEHSFRQTQNSTLKFRQQAERAWGQRGEILASSLDGRGMVVYLFHLFIFLFFARSLSPCFDSSEMTRALWSWSTQLPIVKDFFFLLCNLLRKQILVWSYSKPITKTCPICIRLKRSSICNVNPTLSLFIRFLALICLSVY